jgi:hypothetical protein
MAYETPEFDSPALGQIASHWRTSGIVSARFGDRLNIISGRDNAFIGVTGQRPNQVSDDFYQKTLTNWFNPAAFAQPAQSTHGDLPRNAVVGPAYWHVNLGLARLIPVSATQRMELRLEVFNLLNHLNWGNPVVNFNAGTFGWITTQTGEPRIMQFGIKYDF